MVRWTLVLVVAALAAVVVPQSGLADLYCCDKVDNNECCGVCRGGCRGFPIGTSCGTETACWTDTDNCDTDWDDKCCDAYGGCVPNSGTCSAQQTCCLGDNVCKVLPSECCTEFGGTPSAGSSCFPHNPCLESRPAQNEQVSWLNEDSEAQVCWLDE